MTDELPQKSRTFGLAPDERRCVIENALISRFVEERLLSLFSEGRLNGTVHTCIGEEFSGAVIARHLVDGDTIFSNHRCHGHFLSRNHDIHGLIAELMGRQTGVSGGLGGSQHLYKDGFYSNGLQGGIVPVAAGLALGHKLRRSNNVAVVFIGDGTLGEGVVYETFNIAAKWDLPLLVVLEDNKYSQSTAQHETLAGSIPARAAAFGIETAHGTTWEWEELHHTVGDLVGKMRQDRKPRFLHIETFRLKAHSKGDDTRPRDVVEPFEQRDPLNLFLAQATAEDQALVDSIKARIEDAVGHASNDPLATMPMETQQQAHISWSPTTLPANERVVVSLNTQLKSLLSLHDSTFMIGEDILSPYGGAFKASKDLSDLFPGRVLNTPISEAAIVGIGCGASLMGFHPIVEIMFGDFLTLAFDQILNHAAKFHQMYNQKVMANLIIRTPMGGGRGYGPTHSQTLDRHFFGIPGLRVVAMNHMTSPEQVYAPLIAESAGPCLVIENKRLYGTTFMAEVPQGYELLHSSETHPTAWLKPQSQRVDVTLLGYGGTSELLAEACEILFEEHDLVAQVVCVMQVYPFTVAPILPQLTAAPRLLIVEEGQGFAGFGAEVMAQLAETGALSTLSVGRVAPPAHCIPSSGPLEQAVLPDVGDIVQAVLKMRQA